MDNATIVSKISFPSQEIVKNLLTTALRLGKDNLHKLLDILISEQAGYPVCVRDEDDSLESNLTHCKELFRQLSDEERLCFLQWFMNLVSPLGLQVTYGDELEKLNRFMEFELPRHLSNVGIKDSLAESISEKLQKVSKCLNTYQRKIAELERAMDSAIKNLNLIAESESMIQAGSWSSGKAGCLSVLACRLAIESRNCLRRSYQERNRSYRPDEF